MMTMPGHGEPALLSEGPFLDWYDDLYPNLPYTVPASILAPGLPATDIAPRVLRRHVLSKETSYAERDRAWHGIVALARQPDTAVAYTLIGLGIAVKRLRWYRHRMRLTSAADIADVDADLVHGFLLRLPTVDLKPPNIAGRLISSARGYARHRFAQHVHQPQPIADASSHRWQPRPGNPDEALHRIAARLSAAGPPFTAGDIELIGRTRLDRHTLIEAAAEAGLSLDAAYKRRQRAEARIAALYPRHTPAPPTNSSNGHAGAGGS
jgi:hypothetical protein